MPSFPDPPDRICRPANKVAGHPVFSMAAYLEKHVLRPAKLVRRAG